MSQVQPPREAVDITRRILELDDPFPETVVLDVTAADCERGQRRNEYHCPAARATARRLDGADVRVGSGWIEVRQHGQTTTYLIPTTLRQQIVAFDHGSEFRPGTFRLTRYEGRPSAIARTVKRFIGAAIAH